MSSCYKRKNTRQSWSETSMNNAINVVRSGGYEYHKTSLMYSVPKSTHERRVKGKNKYAKGDLKVLGSRTVTFPPELEKQLVTYMLNMELIFSN